MAVGGIGGRTDAVAPSRSYLIPRVSTRFSLDVENEQAGVGRDGQTRLARPNSQARTGQGKNIYFPCSADHEQDRQHDVYIHNVPYCTILLCS